MGLSCILSYCSGWKHSAVRGVVSVAPALCDKAHFLTANINYRVVLEKCWEFLSVLKVLLLWIGESKHTLRGKEVMPLQESELGIDSAKYIPICNTKFTYLSNWWMLSKYSKGHGEFWLFCSGKTVVLFKQILKELHKSKLYAI